MESCDPGIFPSYFIDFGRPTGQQAWLDIIRTHVVNGSADGVYVDCDPTIPFTCDGKNQTCVAKRNGKISSVNEAVTRASVEAYTQGKNATLYEGYKLVEALGGTFYNKGGPGGPNKTLEQCAKKGKRGKGRSLGDCAGNIWCLSLRSPPFLNTSYVLLCGVIPALTLTLALTLTRCRWTGPKQNGHAFPQHLTPLESHALIKAQRAINSYVVVGGSNHFSSPKIETLKQNISDGRSYEECSQNVLAQFLLAVEPGAYLLCNAWDERFARPLGLPTGDPTVTGTKWTRSFAGGVRAIWDTKSQKGSVEWPEAKASPAPCAFIALTRPAPQAFAPCNITSSLRPTPLR